MRILINYNNNELSQEVSFPIEATSFRSNGFKVDVMSFFSNIVLININFELVSRIKIFENKDIVEMSDDKETPAGLSAIFMKSVEKMRMS